MSKMNEMNLSEQEANKIKEEILHKEGENLRKKRQKISIFDFEPLKIIGKGAFGEVRICKYFPTGDIVAIKKMKKEEMHKKKQILHVRAEKDVLSEAKNPWIVDLKFSFQDQKYLYLGMEFLPGGDLMSLLMEKDILPEQDAKFYAVELVLSIENVHKLNCIHRDLKPDNILIDKDGHIKLSDFGLSKKIDFKLYEDVINNASNTLNRDNLNSCSYAMQFNQFKQLNKNKKRRAYAFSTVGTPDYIAPEVFTREGYGPEVDWWSLGIIMFEMMIGYPPFFSDTSKETCNKILHWKEYLSIPPEANISKEAIDIIKKLITDVNKRLGYKGADEIKRHPFFKGVNWNKVKETMTPTFVPELSSDYDTRYFEDFQEDEPFYPTDGTDDSEYRSKAINKDMCFVDFTYKRDDENYRKGMVSALEVFDSLKDNLNNLEKENKESFSENSTNNPNSNNNIESNVKSNDSETIVTNSKHSSGLKIENNIEEELIHEPFVDKDVINEKNYKINNNNECSENLSKSKTQKEALHYLKNNNEIEKKEYKKPQTSHLQTKPKNNVISSIVRGNFNNNITNHNAQTSLNHKNNTTNYNSVNSSMKPKGISIKNDGLFSQRAKKEKNDFLVNVPKGNSNQKIVFPSSAINTNKIYSNHITPNIKKDDGAKGKKLNLDSGFIQHSFNPNNNQPHNNENKGFKFLKVKENHIQSHISSKITKK